MTETETETAVDISSITAPADPEAERSELIAAYAAERERQIQWRLAIRAKFITDWIERPGRRGPCFGGSSGWMERRGIPRPARGSGWTDPQTGLAEAHEWASNQIPAMDPLAAQATDINLLRNSLKNLQQTGARWLETTFTSLSYDATGYGVSEASIRELHRRLKSESPDDLAAPPAPTREDVITVGVTFTIMVQSGTVQLNEETRRQLSAHIASAVRTMCRRQDFVPMKAHVPVAPIVNYHLHSPSAP